MARKCHKQRFHSNKKGKKENKEKILSIHRNDTRMVLLKSSTAIKTDYVRNAVNLYLGGAQNEEVPKRDEDGIGSIVMFERLRVYLRNRAYCAI